jgi:hypothetical protein
MSTGCHQEMAINMIRLAVKATLRFYTFGYCHRNISPKIFWTPKGNEDRVIISDFRHARVKEDVTKSRHISESPYYFPIKNCKNGNQAQDLVSLALIMMAN